MIKGNGMSDMMIDVINYLIEIGELEEEISVKDAHEYVIGLSEEKQGYLMEQCMNRRMKQLS